MSSDRRLPAERPDSHFLNSTRRVAADSLLFGCEKMTSSTARIAVKLHKNVTLVRTTEPVLAEELLARKTLARWVVGRLSDTVLLVQPDEADVVIEELRRMGHTPRVVR
jgi:hypothetical protein